MAADVVGHGLGDEYLARLGLTRDASGEVDDPADEIAVVVDRLAGVHADAEAEPQAGRGHVLDVALDVDRAQDRVGGARELSEEPVALGAYLAAPARGERGAHELAVTRDDGRPFVVANLLGEPGGVDDVAEPHRDPPLPRA